MVEQREVPSPNAYDSYLAAFQSIEGEVEPPFDDTADKQEVSAGPTMPEFSIEEKVAIVERNAEAIRRLRQGFEYEYLVPPDQPWEQDTSALMGSRDMALLLRLQSDVCESQGNLGDAMKSLLDIVRLSTDIPRGGLIMHALIGKAIGAIGILKAWDLTGSLNADDARAAAGRAEEILNRHWPFRETVHKECEHSRETLMKTLKNPYWKWVLSTENSPSCGELVRRLLRLLPMSKRRASRSMADYADEQIRLAGMPYPVAVSLPSGPQNAVTEILGDWSCTPYRLLVERGKAHKAFLAVALALRAYSLEHRRLPKELPDLTPDYLKSIPNDPFAEDSPVKYRVEGERYTLYSIGPDGVDDGGQPIRSRPFCSGGPADPVWADSTGDIVAGVNW